MFTSIYCFPVFCVHHVTGEERKVEKRVQFTLLMDGELGFDIVLAICLSNFFCFWVGEGERKRVTFIDYLSCVRPFTNANSYNE